MTKTLTELVTASLERPVPDEARIFAQELAAESSGSVAAVLFYGSCLRDQTVEGVLDFYVLVDSYSDYHTSRIGAVANAMLPPTVRYKDGVQARAKIAVISIDAFAEKMRPSCLDTTMWARFCQPTALLYARDAQAAENTARAVADAVATGAVWGTRLGPKGGTPEEIWTALFRNTYGAELRVEDGSDRSNSIYLQAATHFDAMLAPALAHAERQKSWALNGTPDRYRRSWRFRAFLGKFLNISRLLKAVFTFDQRVEYIEWKVMRHTGHCLELTDFQRRHPLIAAPGVLWRLWRSGAVR